MQRMNLQDNVATALVDLTPGMVIDIPGPPVTAGAPTSALPHDHPDVTVQSNVPFGHKVALTDIAAGTPVRKYGEVIGLASANIRAGEHVHTHNVDSQRGRGDLSR